MKFINSLQSIAVQSIKYIIQRDFQFLNFDIQKESMIYEPTDQSIWLTYFYCYFDQESYFTFLLLFYWDGKLIIQFERF